MFTFDSCVDKAVGDYTCCFPTTTSGNRRACHTSLPPVEAHVMVTVIIITASILVTLGCLFLGAYLGYRVGFRDGRRSARHTTEAHWVDLLEVTLNANRSRNAHPSNTRRAVPEHPTELI